MRESYNDYLYRKRKEAGLHRKEVAARLGVSKFLYHRFERGYSVPKPEVVEKINALYGEDFAPYLVGESSYPGEIKHPDESTFREKVKEAFRKRWIKLVCLLVPLFMLLSIPGAIALHLWSDQAAPSFYSETYTQLRESVCHWGYDYADPLGNSHMSILTYERYEDGNGFYAAVKAPTSEKNIGDMQFVFTMRVDDETTLGGVSLVKLQYTKQDRFEFMVIDNQTGEYLIQSGRRLGLDEFELTAVKERFTDAEEGFLAGSVDAVRIIAAYADAFFKDFLTDSNDEGLFAGERFPIESFYEDVFLVKEVGDKKLALCNTFYGILAYGGAPLGILLSGVSLTLFLLSREKEEERKEQVGEETLPNNKRLPFLIGTSAFRVLGSLLFLVGSVYILLSLANRFGLVSLLVKRGDPNGLIEFSSNLFFLGVFFLYILGLHDDFSHPKRLYLRTIAFGTIAFAVAVLQSFFGWFIANYENNLVSFLLSYMPANIFMPIFLYHLCALFLFATPEWAKGKLLKFWRWLAILPVLVSLAVFIYGLILKGIGAQQIQTLSYFLGADRFPYSFVTYCYLLGNFVLRRHWIKKYGAAYLRGDVYAFFKNLTICGPAFLIGAIELILYFVPGARVLGFGECYALLAIAGLMLFYRGYNDKNHLPALISSRIVYAIGLILTYSITIGIAVAYIALGG